MARDTHYDRFKKNKSASLKEFRHFLEYLVLVVVRKFVNVWPVAWAQKFGAGFGGLAMLFARNDRGIARYQLDFCFPKLSPERRMTILKGTFRNMGTSLFEALVIGKIRKKPEYWVKLNNPEIVHESLKEGNGAVLMFAHVGNWELFSIVYEILNINGIAIESPIGVGKLDKVLRSVRESENIKMIPRGDKTSARAILHCFRNNGAFLFAMDQDTAVKTVFVDFFGRKAATALGSATFAQKFNAPVISAFGARMADGTHRFSFELLSKAPYEGSEEESIRLVQHYNNALEKHIREYPDQWVWFHRRWKHQPDEGLT